MSDKQNRRSYYVNPYNKGLIISIFTAHSTKLLNFNWSRAAQLIPFPWKRRVSGKFERQQKKMAESRFAISSKAGIQNLKETASNDNTKKSTQTWINVWRRWVEERGINPNLEKNSAEVLDSILQQFYAEVRKKRGESYEPESLKVMMASLDRYLRERNYPYSIIKDRQFEQSKKVLEGQAKLLRQEGKGKRRNASSALFIPEEEALWENGKLGSSSPRVLCYTMWWILTQHFGL